MSIQGTKYCRANPAEGLIPSCSCALGLHTKCTHTSQQLLLHQHTGLFGMEEEQKHEWRYEYVPLLDSMVHPNYTDILAYGRGCVLRFDLHGDFLQKAT